MLDLDTASRIHRIIPSIVGTCSQYRLIENGAHLFFECSFAGAVWFALSSVGLRAHAQHTQIQVTINQIFLQSCGASENLEMIIGSKS